MATIIRVALVCVVLAACSPRFESRMTDEVSGITVVVDRSWGNRTLIVFDRSGTRVEQELISEWGPDLRTNVYRTTSGDLAVIDFGGEWLMLREPLRLEPTYRSNDWEYLGTLLQSDFRDASEGAECMDVLMDDSPPTRGTPPTPRSWMFRRNCSVAERSE